MSDNVVEFGRPTYAELDPQLVLEAAAKAKLDTVVVMGYDADGNAYFASSTPEGPQILWLLECLKQQMMGDL